jgi:hypothetical protein
MVLIDNIHEHGGMGYKEDTHKVELRVSDANTVVLKVARQKNDFRPGGRSDPPKVNEYPIDPEKLVDLIIKNAESLVP